jgi:MSHA pilin protein MshD
MTLIELIVFIVIVSVALAGVLTVLNVTTKSSADPMIRKQMLAIAEALLEEVQAQSFTWCDPNDRSAATARGATLDATATDVTKCWDKIEVTGPDTIAGVPETRSSATTPFDNVNDYTVTAASPLVLASPIPNVSGGNSAPAGYGATVLVATAVLNGLGGPPNSPSLLITVTVTHGADSIVLEGYRTRYSPNFLP